MGELYLEDDDGTLWQVDPADCELDGNGFWYLAAEGEDHEDYYEFYDGDYDLED